MCMCPVYRWRVDELFTDVQYWGVLCFVYFTYITSIWQSKLFQVYLWCLFYVYFSKIGWPQNNAVNQITEHSEHVIRGDSANLFPPLIHAWPYKPCSLHVYYTVVSLHPETVVWLHGLVKSQFTMPWNPYLFWNPCEFQEKSIKIM